MNLAPAQNPYYQQPYNPHANQAYYQEEANGNHNPYIIRNEQIDSQRQNVDPDHQNNYPVQVDAHVQKAVEGEKQWYKRTCLDRITKLKGRPERQGFVRKVFGILVAQVLFTVILCGIVYATPTLEKWLQNNIWFYYVALVLSILIFYAIVCFRKVARTVPFNYIALFAFTFFESIMVATISSFYNAESVFLAAVLTLVLFTTMTIITLFTSRKPHTLSMMMYAAFGLSIVAILFMIFFTNRYIIIIATVVLLIIACVYVMIDIDLITEKHGLDLDDYIIGALFLYDSLPKYFP